MFLHMHSQGASAGTHIATVQTLHSLKGFRRVMSFYVSSHIGRSFVGVFTN